MISVIIPTLNEELNISHALISAINLSNDVVVLDSGSTDSTQSIVEKIKTDNPGVNIRFIVHHWEGYSKQYNWGIKNISWENNWLFLLAADEIISNELAEEIKKINFSEIAEDVVAYFVKRRFYWMNRWIKHGSIYPFWDARLFKIGFVSYDDRSVNEHLIINGKKEYLRNDILHIDHRETINDWILKHVKYAQLEAEELLKAENGSKDSLAKFWGSQAERKRWIREKIWNPLLPPLIRPFIYFFYRYIIRLGFLDGKAGFIYHFLQGLWFPFLIDVKYLEVKRMNKIKKVKLNL
jgi:glycosyltransferase involved in cell wall biosynthesis